MSNILIIGCGYVGTALSNSLISKDHNVWGLRRNASKLPSTIHPLVCALDNLAKLTLPKTFDYIFYMPSAGENTETRYQQVYVEGAQNLIACLQNNACQPKRIFYISSTSVYAQNDGSWVDEKSETMPESPTAKQLLLGEKMFLDSDYPSTVVRFAGIYGPDRDHFLRRARAGEIALSIQPIYTNRIHRDDCAGMLHFLMQQPSPDSLYLGVDNEPVLKNDLLKWLIETHQFSQLSATHPSAKETRMRSNKRVSNKKISDTGYKFQYPSFKEGYNLLIS